MTPTSTSEFEPSDEAKRVWAAMVERAAEGRLITDAINADPAEVERLRNARQDAWDRNTLPRRRPK